MLDAARAQGGPVARGRDPRLEPILWGVHCETRVNARALGTHGDEIDHQFGQVLPRREG